VTVQRRVVIVGAGIVGCTIAEGLTSRGWTDVTVLEQGPLVMTGGSTSHAPGLVHQFNASKAMTRFATQTIERFSELVVNGQSCFKQVGSLDLALTTERLADLRRRQGLLTSYGVEAQIFSPEECGERHSLLNPEAIAGGLYVPTDGLANPVLGGEIMMRMAESRGARFLPHHRVTDVRVSKGKVSAVVTDSGEFPADIVVCCAGFWGPRIGDMVGVPIPLTPMQHFYAKSSPLPSRGGTLAEATSPILRDFDGMFYAREHHDRFGFGFYGYPALPVAQEDIPAHEAAPVMPSMLPFTGQDHCETSWERIVELLPALRDTKLEQGFNGIFSFTPDGLPIMGESMDVEGFWVAEAVWITHSGGVGKAMVEWIVDGSPEVDVHDFDVNRFERAQLGPEHLLERNSQSFDRNYAIVHPLEPSERPWRTTPFHTREQELQAVFQDDRGWARPQWYASNANLLDEFSVASRSGWEAQHWSRLVGVEHLATRARAGLFDMTPVTRMEVTGLGALGLLQRLTTGDMDQPVGSVVFTLLLDVNGGVRSEVSVVRLGAERFRVLCNGRRDVAWFTRNARGVAGIRIEDVTPATCALGLWGPAVEPVFEQLLEDDAWRRAFKDGKAVDTHLGYAPATIIPVSYVGEPGVEVHTSSECGQEVWDVLTKMGKRFGLVPAGRGSFQSLRVESGMRVAGVDLSTEHSPYEAGLGFAIDMDKGDFIGRSAIATPEGRPTPQRLVSFALDDPSAHLMGKEPIFVSDQRVGRVTSAAYGYSVGHTRGFAWLPVELGSVGTSVEVQYFDRRLSATVLGDPARATTTQ
jgi:glycine cleavage system aminomethyltransferase T/glycine/D-amino acid oxidase-like deaminating enzyme